MMALIAFRFDSPARDSPGNAVAAAQPCQPAPSQGIPMPRWAEGTGSCLEWPGLSSQHGPNNAVLLPWALFVVPNAAGAALLQDGTAVKPPTTCHHKDPMQPHPSSGCSSALPGEMLGHLMKPSAMGQSRSGNMGVTDECHMAMLHMLHMLQGWGLPQNLRVPRAGTATSQGNPNLSLAVPNIRPLCYIVLQ